MDARTLTIRMRGHRGPLEPIIVAEAIELLQGQLDKTTRDLATVSTAVSGISTPTQPPGTASHRIDFTSASATLTDPNDFGGRAWLVACQFTTSIKDLRFVGGWCENPVGTAPVKVAEARYVPNASNSATFILEAPNASRDVRVYLTAILDAGEAQLRTVAEYGEQNASPHKVVTIGPIPTDDRGIERVANVTGLSVVGPTYFNDVNGLYRAKVSLSFTPPSDARWAGVELDVKKPGPTFEPLGRYTGSPTGDITLPMVPFGVQTWRIYARGVDRTGRANTLNETTEGQPTPYVEFPIGDTEGKLDISKALAASLAPQLQIVNNIIGIKPLSLDEQFLQDLTISKAKLQNAPIIDSLRIEDLAVKNQHVENLAAEKIAAGVLGAGVAYIGTLNASQVTAGTFAANVGFLGTLNVNQIQGWSGAVIEVPAGLTLTGGGGLILDTGGYLYLKSGSVYATLFNATGSVGSNYSVGGTQVVGARQPAVLTIATNIPTSGGNVADGCTGDLYNVINDLKDRVNTILARLRTHGLIES